MNNKKQLDVIFAKLVVMGYIDAIFFDVVGQKMFRCSSRFRPSMSVCCIFQSNSGLAN